MIEIEKKFILNTEDEARLIRDAESLGERVLTDIYYDTDSCSLTSKDIWLRERNGKFEIKLPLQSGAERLVDQYNELEDEVEIREALGLAPHKRFAEDLKVAEYTPFCICKTTRRTYKKEAFTIDIDLVDFQSFRYRLAEIELLVTDRSEIEQATRMILSFANEYKLTIGPVRGKVIEYLKRMRPEHYQTLVDVGTVRDF